MAVFQHQQNIILKSEKGALMNNITSSYSLYSPVYPVKGVSGAAVDTTGHGSGSQVMESARSQAERTAPEPEPGFHLL